MAMLEDIIGFLQEGFRNAGQKAKESNESRAKLFNAIRSGQKTNLGPLMQEAMASSQPMAGQISPGFWKGMAPEAKAMMTNVAAHAPDMFEKGLKSKPNLMSFILNKEQLPVKDALGTLERVNPLIDQLSI